MNYIFDTFTNFLSGLGVPGRDKMTGTAFVTTTWTREQLEASYRGDWIARKAISIPAHDATREWRAWQAEQPQIEKLEETEQRLQIQLKLQQALVKARLYGGCCMMIGVEGSMEKELDPDTIKKDGLKFVHVFAPHQLTIEEMVKDIEDPYYGQPTFYRLQDESKKFGDVKIHPSRMVRLLGLDSPDPMKNNGWGDPLMQMINDAVSSAGTVAQSVATLIQEAKLDVIKIPGLTEIFSTSNGTNRLIKRFTEANVAKSVINGIIMDAEEEWERIGVNFAGMPEILQMYLQIAAGAADIPMTRFAGMSPAGLNSTGESDLSNYYDRISSDQELRLTPALEKLDKAIVRSALGKSDDNIFYEWNSLWQMTDKEKAEIAKQKADTAMVDVNSGLIPPEALMKGRVNQLIEDGTYPGLEAAIEEALAAQEMLAEEEEQKLLMPPARGAWMSEQPGGEGEDEGMESGPPAGPFAPKKKPKAEVARDSVGPFGIRLRMLLRTQLRTQLPTLLDRLIEWDEGKHPRDEEGKFTFGGGGFVSPSVKTGLDFKGAVKELDSRQQGRLRLASKDINTKVGISNAKEVNIVGVWKDGAENSIMSRSDADWNQTVLATVMKGHLADQKSVLVFQQQERGVGVLAQFEATGKLAAIEKKLEKAGIVNHTVVPHKDGATIYVIDEDGSNLAKIDAAAEKFADDNPVYYQTGRAEFIGDPGPDEGKPIGSDREQRDRARKVYESVIEQSSVPQAQAIWKDVRDYWGAPNEKGYALTPNAIIADNPNIKKRSVKVGDAAKMINVRASEILQRDHGVKYIDEANTTPERDEYLSRVIAMELRENLIGGNAQHDWYDSTMRAAMSIAEEIYPGMRNDPDKKFAFTVALAITSQGETVTRSADLADQAYTQFLKDGKFPETLETADPNITENFKKVNEHIAQSGSVRATREFFDKQMTKAELTKATTVNPSATGVDDIMYGSAMLGPKIGQGFYQNLNGNFEPITMDMWFMRAFGRITNTGVKGGSFSDQYARVDRALIDGGMPPPKYRYQTLKIARDVTDQHEKDYDEFKAEYKSGKRKKSELVRASERLTLMVDGMLNEQPERVEQRHWMTRVFTRAIDILHAEHGTKLTPAGAQATWWWPEKVLWEEMGVAPRDRDGDYLVAMKGLAAKKGVKL
jgi:phage-related protein (TIGR01555 family)